MKIADILKLMKAGYNAGEISELERKDEILELVNGGVKKDDVPEYLKLLDEAPEDPDREEPEEDPEPEKEKEPAEDYKKLYEELKAKTEKAAARKDLSGQVSKKTADELLAEIAVDYM